MGRNDDELKGINKFIGDRIYSLRTARGMSRQQLGELIGVSHQQLQKYEQGKNRTSAARLSLIAKALKEEINYFYLETYDNSINQNLQHPRLCLEISRNFMAIKKSGVQDAIHKLVKNLAKTNT